MELGRNFFLLIILLIVVLVIVIILSNVSASNQNLELDTVYVYEDSDAYVKQIKLFDDESCQMLPFSTTLALSNGDNLFRANNLYIENCGQVRVIPHQLETINSELIFIFNDASIAKVNTDNPDEQIILQTDLNTIDGELALALNGKLYASKPFDPVIYANYGPTSLYEIDYMTGASTFLAELDLTTGRYPSAMCGGPDGHLYMILTPLQIIGGLGYSDWPSIFIRIDIENDYAVTELGEIGGNFGWPGKDMVILDGWIYVSGYRIPDYFGIIGRFRLDDPQDYEELSDPAFTGFFGNSRIFGLAVADGKLWAGRDDTFFELDPSDGSLIGPIENLERTPLVIQGATSLESIAAIGAYKVIIEEFNLGRLPSTFTTEQAVNIINNDSRVNFKYAFMPAGSSFTIARDPNTGNFDVMQKDPYVVIQR